MAIESRRYQQRQEALAARRPDGRLERGTAVVVPSISFPSAELVKIVAIGHYEERMLFTLLWLAEPSMRVAYVTSLPIDDAIVEYYLSFLDDPESARDRLLLLTLHDPEPRALSSKLLERPDLIRELTRFVGDEDAYLLPFNVTPWERDVADLLDVPVFGPDPELAHLGSKSGSRRVARAAGVPVLEGTEDLFSLEKVSGALEDIARRVPGAEAAVVKLNYGFSGQGNAILDLTRLKEPLGDTPTVFCAESETWDTYGPKFVAEGGVAERLLRGPGVVSPSGQVRITPTGEVELISTHDQILGGPDSQVYLGCRFPARPEYRNLIQEYTCRVAAVLAEAGVVGSFGMDYIGLPEDDGYRMYLGEINLRLGGTTHPFQMARLATGGSLDVASGNLVVDGRPKFYVASDNFKSPTLVGVSPSEVVDRLRAGGLTFDRNRGSGATLHLLGALPGFGKVGALCIADSIEEAEERYAQVAAILGA